MTETATETESVAPGVQRPYELLLVTYHSRDLVEEFLRLTPDDVPLVVVDNAQGLDGMEELLRDRPRTRYLHGEARGYGAAANLGVRTSEYEYIVSANPDSTPSMGQLDAMVGELERDETLGLVTLTSVLPDGTIELGVAGWEPTAVRALVHAVGVHKLLPERGLWARPRPGQEISVDWIGGACQAFRRGVFLELGGYDESYFLYSEDVELGRRLREAGYRQKVLTGAEHLVRHLGAGSGGAKTTMLRMRGAMQMKYLRRHNPVATSAGIRAVLTAGYAGRYLLARLRGRRATASEHAAYIHGLWRGAPDMSGPGGAEV